jgi:hypothetical protein
MELLRVVAGRASGAEVARLTRSHQVLFRCADADTVMTVASWREELVGPLGVWLVVGPGYRAQMAARDVKTLAALVPISRVVIEAPSPSSEHAAVVGALLTDDEVNFANEVATLLGAYNRPAPPSPIEVWSYEDERLTRGDDTLALVRREASDVGELTYFA